MQPIATLMHALSSPADYTFDWRDGELFIEPKVNIPATGHHQRVHQTLVQGSNRKSTATA